MIDAPIVKAADFVALHEGFVDHVYTCPGGHQTFGYGSLLQNYSDVKFPITEEQAKVYLRNDLVSAFNVLDQYVDVPLNLNQSIALASFIYNVGSGNFITSTLRKVLNLLRYDKASQELLRWTKANGKDLPGLIKRREDERVLFLTPC